jgi:hypothetical protein
VIQFLITLLRPLLAEIVIRLVERYQSDPRFKAELDVAAGRVKNAQTKEEMLDAAKAYQDALFR